MQSANFLPFFSYSHEMAWQSTYADSYFSSNLTQDYMNSEFEGLAAENVEKPFTDTLDRNKQHRLPWHDIHMR